MIDFWDVRTFDDDLLSVLKAKQRVIERFQNREDHIFNNYDRSGSPGASSPRPSNEHYTEFQQFVDEVGQAVFKSRPWALQ